MLKRKKKLLPPPQYKKTLEEYRKQLERKPLGSDIPSGPLSPPPPEYDTPSGEEQYKKILEEYRKQLGVNRTPLGETKPADEVTPEEEETLRETMRKQVEESKYKRGGMVKSKARGCGVAVRGLTKGRMY